MDAITLVITGMDMVTAAVTAVAATATLSL